jgi:hypothetical protein
MDRDPLVASAQEGDTRHRYLPRKRRHKALKSCEGGWHARCSPLRVGSIASNRGPDQERWKT